MVLSLAILTHNFLGLCAFLFCGFLLGGAFLRAMLLRKASSGWFLRTSGSWCAAMVLALACTAFFWAPALLDRKYVNIKQILLTHYWNHFLYWSNLTRLNFWGYGASLPGPFDTMPLHLGYVSLVAACSGLAALGCTLFAWKNRLGWAIIMLLGATTAAVLSTTWVSKPLWDRFTLLQNGQFPWRLLSFGALGCSLLLPSFFVALEACAGRSFKEKVSPFLLLILAGCSVLSQSQYGRVRVVFDVPDDAITEAWSQTPVTSTEQGEYQPIWSVGKVRSGSLPGQVLIPWPAQAVPVQNRASDGSWGWRVQNACTSPVDMTVALNYFPAWKAWDVTRRRRLEVVPEWNTGFLRIVGIVPGQCEVRLRFANTPVRQAAWWVSAAGASVLLCIGGREILRRKTLWMERRCPGRAESATKLSPAAEFSACPPIDN